MVSNDKSHPSVKFAAMHENSSKNLKSVTSNLAIAKESHFNRRYTDYVRRVKEVNNAKEMLRSNREAMSAEIKR